MAKKEKITFEEAFDRLEKAAAAVGDENTPLDKAIESYKEGREYYDYCMKILQDAKQVIETFDKETGTMRPVEEQ